MNAVSSGRFSGILHAGRGSRLSWLLATLASLSLLAPSLAGFQPDVAGWLPGHGHVYQSGMPVPHAHPWDSIRGGVAVPFDHSHAETAPDAGGGSTGVTFTWDTASTVFAVVVPAVAVVMVAAVFLRLSRSILPGVLVSTVFDTPTPPPR